MTALGKLRDRIIQKLVRDPAGYGRPVPKAAFDAEYSSGNWSHFSSFEELPRYLVLAGAVNHFFPCPSVLDVGCGDGRLAKALQRYPFSAYLGVDLSSEGIARARALDLASMEFTEGNFETWRPLRAFDAIIFNETIGYAQDPGATLAALSPHLSRQGLYFISLFRSGSYRAQWSRMERACTVVDATAVMSPGGKVWDIKVLKPPGS